MCTGVRRSGMRGNRKMANESCCIEWCCGNQAWMVSKYHCRRIDTALPIFVSIFCDCSEWKTRRCREKQQTRRMRRTKNFDARPNGFLSNKEYINLLQKNLGQVGACQRCLVHSWNFQFRRTWHHFCGESRQSRWK